MKKESMKLAAFSDSGTLSIGKIIDDRVIDIGLACPDLPGVSVKLDYKVRMPAGIGARCRGVSQEDAHKVIAGYRVTNDVAVRDWRIASFTRQ